MDMLNAVKSSLGDVCVSQYCFQTTSLRPGTQIVFWDATNPRKRVDLDAVKCQLHAQTAEEARLDTSRIGAFRFAGFS